jgi:gamma-aminobutyrate permease
MANDTDLSKALRARHITMISIGGIIGAGLFVGSSAAIAAAGPAIIVSYLLAGGLIFCIMRMLAELASANPHIGSFTEYARLGLGNWAGFISGWLYWYFWVIVVAIEAIAGAAIIALWIDLPVWQIQLVLMIALTVVNLMSARSYGEFEFWFSSIKVGAIVAFILLAAAAVFGIKSAPGAGFDNLVAHGGFAPNGWIAVLASVVTVIFALCGAEIATIAAAESAESSNTIARLTITIMLRILLFYVLSIGLIVCVLPWTDIKPGLSPFATALERMNIPGAATAMNFVVLTAVLSCLNSGVYVTSRILFRLAEKGDAPQAMVKLNSRRIPARAILVGSSFGYLAVIAAVFSPTKLFAFLVNASGALMLIIYLLLALSQLRLRRQLEATAPERLKIRVWLFPWLTYVVAGSIVVVLGAMLLREGSRREFFASLVCVAVVAGAYWLRARRRAASSAALSS